ncbi:Na/Pi cotransporter family protein [Proteobacteria bacterium 005FR1]|nr:Na/Pi cotransporter family protein [Proteobacteria bacterium 005FR1]
MIFELLGSLGLFLLGMWLLTEGLKLAGGKALEGLLGQWTSSRIRGLASGVLITAIVQSSSAVTVATIGFVNAGLMKFQRALWVVFGSNLGTTFTAWIVTFFGFTVKVDAFTFPLIGVGAALRIFSPYERGKALGMAMAGFGLLFMGIEALKNSFAGFAGQLDVQTLFAGGGLQVVWGLVVGLVLTLVTQSSSAAIAIILTAVASGVAGLDAAAAAVIGANIGTTSTAFIATIGATANAKRLAWAHVIFNALTGAVALVLLPLFIRLTDSVTTSTDPAGGDITVLLAIFHTGFNLLGVLLMLPAEPRLAKWLLGRYRKVAQASALGSHLDANVATIPDLALRAMTLELDKLLQAAGRLQLPLSPGAESTEHAIQNLENRLERLNRFSSLTSKSRMTATQSQLLTLGLRVGHHLSYACATLREVGERISTIRHSPVAALAPLREWFALVDEHSSTAADKDSQMTDEHRADLAVAYRDTKSRVLDAAVQEQLDADQLDTALQAASHSRRFVEQLWHAGDAYRELSARVFTAPFTAPFTAQQRVESETPVDPSEA